MKKWFTELERIIQALEAHDADLAAQRVNEHIGHAADFEMKLAAKAASLVRAAKAA